MDKPTQQLVRSLFYYNPETGLFTRKKTINHRSKKGAIAGTLLASGYILISIGNKQYYASRLAFLYMEGYFPEGDIDHKNRIKNDNRWCNLRHVSRQCNSRNCDNHRHNTSGVKGVHWDKRGKKWKARIKVDSIAYSLGEYAEMDEAVLARYTGEQCLDWYGCSETSPALKYCIKHGLIRHRRPPNDP